MIHTSNSQAEMVTLKEPVADVPRTVQANVSGRRVAIIGGGPGGLFTAYCLQKHARVPYEVTIFESSHRLGGKIVTNQFTHAPVSYEAGAAELYDYSGTGEDNLRELTAELGLFTSPMDGHRVIVQSNRGTFSEADTQALEDFDRVARECISPQQFYDSDWKELVDDPLGKLSFKSALATIDNATVRDYVQTMIHSDLATEPHLTNAIYGLQNYLMNDPAYMRLYTIDGGMEQLTKALIGRIEANYLLNHKVTQVEQTLGGRIRISASTTSTSVEAEFDFVVVALPNHLLPRIEWAGSLDAAMRKHHAHYDYPAHYLRVSILFERPFWREHVRESYFMLDDYGGCCVYDESTRNGDNSYGVLGWLLGGEPAQEMCRLPDHELIEKMLGTLPVELPCGRALFVEGRVHRWASAVNGMPSGYPPLPMETRHRPEPVAHPNLLVVGDYLFDSTLNGVLDSADYVAAYLAAEIEQERKTSSC